MSTGHGTRDTGHRSPARVQWTGAVVRVHVHCPFHVRCPLMQGDSKCPVSGRHRCGHTTTRHDRSVRDRRGGDWGECRSTGANVPRRSAEIRVGGAGTGKPPPLVLVVYLRCPGTAVTAAPRCTSPVRSPQPFFLIPVQPRFPWFCGSVLAPRAAAFLTVFLYSFFD